MIPNIANEISNISIITTAKLGIKIYDNSININTTDNTIRYIILPFLVTMLLKSISLIVIVPYIANAKRRTETTIIKNALPPKISDKTNIKITNFMQILYHTNEYNAINIKSKMNNN